MSSRPQGPRCRDRLFQRAGILCSWIGKKGHVEVNGLTGDLTAGGGMRSWRLRWEYGGTTTARLGVIAQTTTADREASRNRAPHRGTQSACPRCDSSIPSASPRATGRQAGSRPAGTRGRFSGGGGRCGIRTTRDNSYARAREKERAPCTWKEAEELEEQMFLRDDVVGLTAGTSTLPETIAEVRRRLAGFCGAGRNDSLTGAGVVTPK